MIQWLQYKIVHRILTTNSFKKKIIYINNPLCNFCVKEEETIAHLFCECECTYNLWIEIVDWVLEKCALRLQFTKMEHLFGKYDARNPIVNMIINLVNSYVYRLRC